jgi:F-type H+-transporting ATPase subunit epsilon
VKLEVLTPEKTLYKGKIKSINVPGSKGSFTVLLNHAPIISTLVKGKLEIVTEGMKREIIEIAGGVMEVKKNQIIVLADLV